MPKRFERTTFEGSVYRFHNPRWAFAPTSGDGAKAKGGRYNRPGVAALYLSLDPITALNEVAQDLAYLPPSTSCSYDARVEDVVDLSTAQACRQAGFDPADLKCPWLLLSKRGKTPPTWTMADALVADGVAGILVPSFAPRNDASSLNLVLWSWSDRDPHRITPVDPESRLPRDQSSWPTDT
jgi:RES domain-containing protein